MAREAVTPLPEDDYLTLIGQVAYMVSSLEWTTSAISRARLNWPV